MRGSIAGVNLLRFLFALGLLGGLLHWASAPLRQGEELPWRWGMDFSGGVQLIYQVQGEIELRDPAELAEDMELSRKGLRERVVAFHTEESRVVVLGQDRILVEVPGIQDIERVKREIGRPQYLTIRGVLETTESIRDDPGWYPLPAQLGTGSVRLSEPGCRGEHIRYREFKPPLPIDDKRWGFALPLTEPAQELFSEFSTEFAQREVAIVLDGKVRDILYVIQGGLRTPEITTPDRTDGLRLQKLLASGPLPLPFELVQQKTVSPVLAALRQAALQALGLGIALLVLFFTLNYMHRPLFLIAAAGAALFELGAFVALANLGWVRISLPQLAGLALLLGMSVDAFILVFEHVERPPPEGAEPPSLRARLREAFRTELGVIFWANLSTVLSLGGLFFVEGILREYFVLLALGVGISFSAALFLHLLLGVGLLERLTRPLARERPVAPWLPRLRRLDLLAAAPAMRRFYRWAVPLALLLLVGCWLSGRLRLGIDFTGGGVIVVQTGSEVDPERVRELADDHFAAPCEVQLSPGDLSYSIRVPRVLETIGGEGQDAADPQARVGDPRATVETRLLERLRRDLDVPVHLISVDQLGGAAAFANVLSSLRNAAWGLLVLSLLCAGLYISLRVPAWILLALAVDLLLVLAVVVVLGLPIDYATIAALLTFAGYSINDSIVVCHEVRALGKPHMDATVDGSDRAALEAMIQEALAKGLAPLSSRIALTSLTTMLTMVPLIFQGGVLSTFGTIFVLGTLVGTLSSVYIVGVNAGDIVMGDTIEV